MVEILGKVIEYLDMYGTAVSILIALVGAAIFIILMLWHFISVWLTANKRRWWWFWGKKSQILNGKRTEQKNQ